jgi:hypothetical protein
VSCCGAAVVDCRMQLAGTAACGSIAEARWSL